MTRGGDNFLDYHLIRPYQAGDEYYLIRLDGCWPKGGSPSPKELASHFEHVIAKGGSVWSYYIDNKLVGYALMVPIPGLPEIVELEGCIDSRYRRKGLGTRLLDHLMTELKSRPVKQLTHGIHSLDNPGSHFLLRAGFYLEHEEWRMVKRVSANHSASPLPAGYAIRTLEAREAARLFRQLYRQAFSGLPWYQPYLTDAEVLVELDTASNLLFLWQKEDPIGFAWLRFIRPGRGEIEPIGLLKRYRGQGLGRMFLEQAIYRLARLDITLVQIGAWKTNSVALGMYEELGFVQEMSTYYLAHDLKSEP